MFTRTIDWIGHPDRLDALIHYTNEALDRLGELEGFVGTSLIADRAAGRFITTSAWRSEEARDAVARELMPIVATGVDIAGGTIEDARIDGWEVALMHRDHRSILGACSRVTWAEWTPSDIDRVVTHFRDVVIPEVDSEGFCSASLFVDRATGLTCATVSYDSVDAMTAARQSAVRLRAAAASEFDGRILEVGEFEVCVAHLRVPERV